MPVGVLWAVVLVAAARSDAASPAVRLLVAVSATLLLALALTGRHIRHLTARLRDADAREVALVHQAGHDPLTGLTNRALLFERLRLELRRLGRSGGSVLVAYLDVNDLKVVNDSFGHGAGDRMLQTSAARLTAAVRDVDTVARIGGDEFVVVSAVDGPEAADRLIERLRAAAAQSLHPVNAVGLSLGWVVTRRPDDEPGALLAQADVAMYRVKRAGRAERGSVRLQGGGDRDPCGCPGGYGFHLIGCPLAGSDAPADLVSFTDTAGDGRGLDGGDRPPQPGDPTAAPG